MAPAVDDDDDDARHRREEAERRAKRKVIRLLFVIRSCWNGIYACLLQSQS